jgi:acyl dehydratase
MSSAKLPDLHVGAQLRPLEVPLTASLIVSAAIASRDFAKVHHDLPATRDSGSPDIFMNILSSNGFVGRYVTDWAGPGAVIRKISIRLLAQNFPGDTMTMSGEVTDISADGVVELAVRGTNSLGDHVRGRVSLTLGE